MKIIFFAVICLLLVAVPSSGDDSVASLRCGGGLISIGANRLEITSKCGRPAAKDIRDHVWTYNFGPNDYLHTLRFEGSTLVEIRRGGRGY